MKTMRRIIPMLMALILILSFFATTALASGTLLFITTGKAYMRSEPNKNATKVATVPKGEVIKTPDFKTDSRGVKWYFTCYETKKGWVDGWISEKNLKLYNGGHPTPEPTVKPSAKPTTAPTSKPHYIDKTKMITTGSCYLRKNADKDSKKLDTLPEGTIFTTERYEKDDRGVRWYYTKYDGTKGWVSEKNLKHYHAPDPTAKPTPRPINYDAFKEYGAYMQVTASSLNMRMAPATDYSIVETLYTGDVVYAVRTNGEWAEVDDTVHGRHGYMAMKYLAEIKTPKTIYPQITTMNVNAITDGDYSVAFNGEDVRRNEDGIIIMKGVTVYAREIYDIVDIAKLSVGDVIVIEGVEVVVDSVENNGFVVINGGLDNGGYDLRAEDESNCYVVCGYDDMPTFTELGTRDFVIDSSVVYTDNSDLSNRVEANIDSILVALNTSEYAYSPYNTMIHMENGAVTSIERFYTP